MPDNINLFEEKFSKAAYVTTLAAGAKETLASTPQERSQYGQYNSLIVTNRDAVDVKIILDDNANITGNIFEIQAGTNFVIDPSEGILFSFVSITNLHSATAVTANTIRVRWARYVPQTNPDKLGLK
jgi:hypothetical protein